MRVLAVFLSVVAVPGAVVAAQANAFDDCVLQYMPGVTLDTAAKSIKVACLRKNSVILSTDELGELRIVSGFYGTFGRNTPGFTAEVKNDTGYIITEITFAISTAGGQNEFFRVDEFFYQEPGVTIYPGPPPDPSVHLRIDPMKSKKFQFEADRPEIDKKKKWNWFIAGAKVIVTK